MKEFSITVTGIQRQEYYEACRESGRRIGLILGMSMLVICGAIMLVTRSISLAAILGPLAVYLLLMLGYGLLTRINYKNQLAVMDPPMEYEFSSSRWKLRMGDQQAETEWTATPKLRRTRRCIFLYSDEVSGNLIPLRLLSQEQAECIETWYRSSREQARAYLKEEEKKRRQQFRDTHPGLRLGRTGPVWGPWKRK